MEDRRRGDCGATESRNIVLGGASRKIFSVASVFLFPGFFAARDDVRGTGFQPVNRSRPGWPCHTLVTDLPRRASVVSLFFAASAAEHQFGIRSTRELKHGPAISDREVHLES